MTVAPRRWAAELLHVWFSDLAPADWWRKSDDVDAMLRQRFETDLIMLGQRPDREFLRARRTAQAAILLFDQIPRNLYRDDPRAFAWDPLARNLSRGFIARGWDKSVPLRERPFVYMPMMHSEDIADQLASLSLFARYAPANLSFARSHHRMIARFGRFPHRNDIFDRKSTAEEKSAVKAGFSW